MHRTCRNTSVKPDRSSWKARSENLCKGNLSTSLLDESARSDAAQSDCENRTVIKKVPHMEVWFEIRLKNDMPVRGLAGCH